MSFNSDDGQIEILVKAWHNYTEGTDTYEYTVTNISHCGIIAFAVARNNYDLAGSVAPPGWGSPQVEPDRWGWDGAGWAQPKPGSSVLFQVTVAGHVAPTQGRVSIWSARGCVLGKQDITAPTPGDPIRIAQTTGEVPHANDLAAIAASAETIRACCGGQECRDLAWADCAAGGGRSGPPGSTCTNGGCGQPDLALVTLDGSLARSDTGDAVLGIELQVANAGSAQCTAGIPVVVEAFLPNGLWLALGEPILLPDLAPGERQVLRIDLLLPASRTCGEGSVVIRAFANPLHYLPAFDFELAYSNNVAKSTVSFP